MLWKAQKVDHRQALNKRKQGQTTNKTIIDNRIYVAGKSFLIDDIYLMQNLGLRPEKREKDRQRMVKLARIITKKPIKRFSATR